MLDGLTKRMLARKLFKVILLIIFVFTSGCDTKQLPGLKDDVRIAISFPTYLSPATDSVMVISDLQENREIFLKFYKSAKQIGTCSPVAVAKKLDGHEVMFISYLDEGITFTILQTASGEWLTTGFGSGETLDHPERYPKYKYSRKQLTIIREWHKKNAVRLLRAELLKTEPFGIKIPEIKAAISIWYYARLLKHDLIGEGQELYVFDVGALSIDDVDRYKRALIDLGWIAHGLEKHMSKEWPVTEEYVFHKKEKEMSFWAGGSFGMGMVGIKVPN